MTKHFTLALLCLSLATVANAARIAVIDSGVDYKHTELNANIWENPGTTITDADGKVYNDVQYGWNFAENNNQVIDYKYLNTFSADCYRIFEVQAKILTGTATQAEQDWYTAKKNDANFLKELSKFGNFVHGTHVSGISAEAATKSEIQAIKIIPTAPPGSREIADMIDEVADRGADNPMAKMFLQMLAKRQAELLISVGKFVAGLDAEVANGSFGTSVRAVAPVLKDFLKNILGQEPSPQDTEDYAKFFITEIAKAARGFVDSSPKTLFVFAAGNDGSDNDSLPVSPANIKATNSISVAATNGSIALASFSNWGNQMVEVAAPGVAIDSTIPGDKRLLMSGTSMAAPFVTNVAGLVKDANPSLDPAGIKKVLMETVDVKAFLQGKVSTGGIVNRTRALQAARLSRSMPLDQAIQTARRQVRDAYYPGVVGRKAAEVLVTPLPSLF